MSTLIGSTTASSSRTCNARCYNATRRECHCRCCGVNHGIGALQAGQNAREIGSSSIRAATKPGAGKRNSTVPREQGELFSAG